MPIKRRLAKGRTFRVTPEAVARWREVGPAAMDGTCILDDELADALGLHALLAMPDEDLAELRAALDEAAEARHAD